MIAVNKSLPMQYIVMRNEKPVVYLLKNMFDLDHYINT